MAYKGTETAWMRNLDLGEQEDWTREPALPDGQAQHKTILKNVSCPVCGQNKNVEKYKVHGRVGFSRIKCMRCSSITTAQEWRCNCDLRWPKCEVHTLKTLMRGTFLRQSSTIKRKVIKKGMKDRKGHEQAYPRRRINDNQIAVTSCSQPQHSLRTFLKAGSLLARRFPRLYELQ